MTGAMSVFFRFQISFQKEMIFTTSKFVDLKYPPSSALRMTFSLRTRRQSLRGGPDYLFHVDIHACAYLFSDDQTTGILSTTVSRRSLFTLVPIACSQATGTGTRYLYQPLFPEDLYLYSKVCLCVCCL